MVDVPVVDVLLDEVEVEEELVEVGLVDDELVDELVEVGKQLEEQQACGRGQVSGDLCVSVCSQSS